MITIVLPVSRTEYLERVITCLELLNCDHQDVNMLAIVDGDDALFLRVRNLVNGSKFNNRLTVKSGLAGAPPRLDVPTRRQRIAFIHNHARKLISHDDGYVFLVEDDTVFGTATLNRLLQVANNSRAFGMAVGVEVARWGVPYLGAWQVDDIYEPTQIRSVQNLPEVSGDEPALPIDAGGLYCSLVRTRLYKDHEFHFENGLGPDVNFGIEMRQQGYDNYLVWQAQCSHYNTVMGREVKITPKEETKVVTLTKTKSKKWHTSY